MKLRKFVTRFFTLYMLLNCLLFLTACSATWVTSAEAIIAALVPAVQGILVIIAGLGAGISVAEVDSIQKWGTEAQNDLQNVVLPLIQQYNAAEATAKPGILTEISTALTLITNNLTTLLPTLHITDPATQQKVQLVVTEVADEFQALLNLIPVVQGTVKDHREIKALFSRLKTADQFREDFNHAAAPFNVHI